MYFVSTRGSAPRATLEEAVFAGPAPDGGLYVSESLPRIELDIPRGGAAADTASIVARQLFRTALDGDAVEALVRDSLDFEIPVVELSPRMFGLELFHGPTHAFKDVGARFLSRLVAHFASFRDREATVLVATSGDTGSAVAHAFSGLEGVRVVVLFPRGKVSRIQRLLFTTLGGNVTSIAVEGTFDDCQRLVKKAFADPDTTGQSKLVSANSINVGRLLPQIFYYFHLAAQFSNSDDPPVVSTPSGNFGNLTAGLMAKRMGARIARFVASTNANDVVPEYLTTGEFRPRPSTATMSNAMDVGDPSNFSRIQWLYDGDAARLRRDVTGCSFSDEQTADAIRSVFARTGYVLDPHSAVGLLGAESVPSGDRVFLSTAHPAKFGETVARMIDTDVAVPETLARYESRQELVTEMDADYEDLKQILYTS